jgi:hypothetical protein
MRSTSWQMPQIPPFAGHMPRPPTSLRSLSSVRVATEAANIRHGASIVNASSRMTYINLEKFQGIDHMFSLIQSWLSTFEGETVKAHDRHLLIPLKSCFADCVIHVK